MILLIFWISVHSHLYLESV